MQTHRRIQLYFAVIRWPTVVAFVVLAAAIVVVEVGWRDSAPGLRVDVPVPRMAEPLVERLRSAPLTGIDDPRAPAIASGVIFGRTEHVTAADQEAFLASGLQHLLGVSGPDDWGRWIESVDKIAALNPKVVIAGHKRADLPDDDMPAILDGTRDYISAFIEELADAEDRQTLIARMTQRFPDRINATTLHFSAAAAIEQKQRATAAHAPT